MPIESMAEMRPIGATQYLERPGGRVAYDDTGSGPLVIATPAMLDLRSELRFHRPLLVRAGFRVVTVDQRGIGETSGEWHAYDSVPLARDLIALKWPKADH